MSHESNANGPHKYVLVLRASSAAMFRPDDSLTVNVPTAVGNMVLTFRTRHLEKGLQDPLPGDLWVDARGPASSLKEAVSVFGKAAESIIPVIALSANAAVGDLEPELVYDNTAGLSRREFLQSFIPAERAIVHALRPVNVSATRAVLAAVEGQEDRDRIGRAISQYALALRHWRWGHEILATAHLFMGMEALTKAVVRARQHFAGLTDEEFASQLGIDPTSLQPEQSLIQVIETTVRRSILFQRDEDCYKDAKDARHGFVHGYMPFDQIRERASTVRDKTAKYLREAVLDLVGLGDAHRAIVLESPFHDPLGNWPVAKYLRGHLVGDSDELGSEGNEYPIMSWHSTLSSIEVSEMGEYEVRFDEEVTARLGEGTSFEPGSYEVWRP